MYVLFYLPFLQSMIRLLLSGPVESFTFFCTQQQLIYCKNNTSYMYMGLMTLYVWHSVYF